MPRRRSLQRYRPSRMPHPLEADEIPRQGKADDLALAVLEHLVGQHPTAPDEKHLVEWLTLVKKRRSGLAGLEMETIGKTGDQDPSSPLEGKYRVRRRGISRRAARG